MVHLPARRYEGRFRLSRVQVGKARLTTAQTPSTVGVPPEGAEQKPPVAWLVGVRPGPGWVVGVASADSMGGMDAAADVAVGTSVGVALGIGLAETVGDGVRVTGGVEAAVAIDAGARPGVGVRPGLAVGDCAGGGGEVDKRVVVAVAVGVGGIVAVGTGAAGRAVAVAAGIGVAVVARRGVCVAVGEGDAIAVGAGAGVVVGGAVNVGAGVAAAIRVGVSVAVGEGNAIAVGVGVGVVVGGAVNVGAGVAVAVRVGVSVAVGEGVAVAVEVGEGVAVGVGVGVIGKDRIAIVPFSTVTGMLWGGYDGSAAIHRPSDICVNTSPVDRPGAPIRSKAMSAIVRLHTLAARAPATTSFTYPASLFTFDRQEKPEGKPPQLTPPSGISTTELSNSSLNWIPAMFWVLSAVTLIVTRCPASPSASWRPVAGSVILTVIGDACLRVAAWRA